MSPAITFFFHLLLLLFSTTFIIISCYQVLIEIQPSTFEQFVPQTKTLPLIFLVAWNIVITLVFITLHALLWNNSLKLTRSLYVIALALLLQGLIWGRRPITEPVIWNLSHRMSYRLCVGSFLLGTIFTLLTILTMDPLELLGISQVFNRFYNLPSPMSMKTKNTQRLYERHRHPCIIGMMLILWSTPVMTIDRLILAFGLTFYYLHANSIDERDVQYVASQWDKVYAILEGFNPFHSFNIRTTTSRIK